MKFFRGKVGKPVEFVRGKSHNYYCWNSTELVWNSSGVNTFGAGGGIGGLQPVPRDSVNKGVVAMLGEQTKEANPKSFVYDHQHGGDDVTCKPRILEG